ncbi:hypothetical protein TNCV_4339021 [Trichonephila clavipes]|nr:hypothetical protein TNCV_4339021 [Trichonephila clavipes]
MHNRHGDRPNRLRPIMPISVCVPLDDGVHVLKFRPSGQSDTKSQVFSFQASLVLIIDPLEGWKAESTLPGPGFERHTCGVEARYNTTQPLGFHEKDKIRNLIKYLRYLTVDVKITSLQSHFPDKVPLKFHRLEKLMNGKPDEDQTPPIGMVWKLEETSGISGVILVS